MFIRSCGVISVLYTIIMRTILLRHLSPSDSPNVAGKIRNMSSYQRKTATDIVNLGNYDSCDINLLYIFIMHSPCPQPTNGWGAVPDDSDTNIGDDVERMRQAKEYLVNQSISKYIEKEKYKKITEEAFALCKRMDKELKVNNAPNQSSYFVDLLQKIQREPLNETRRTEYTTEMDQVAEHERDMKQEKLYFAKLIRIVLELNPSIMQHILSKQLPWKHCINIAPNLKNKKGEKLLRPNQLSLLNDADKNKTFYNSCDTSIMYILLRNACTKTIPPPVNRWANVVTGYGIGDDIERIRQIRNQFGHSDSASLSSSEYLQLIDQLREIYKRVDSPGHSCYMSPGKPLFLPMLEQIEKECMGTEILEQYMRLLDERNKTELDYCEKIDSVRLDLKYQHRTVMEEGMTLLHRFTLNCRDNVEY